LSLNERAVELVVDESQSMWGRIDDEPKMSIAKEILEDASVWLPNDLTLALRAYGNASRSEAKNCEDSTLLVPFAAANRAYIRDAIRGLQPLGQTPIAYALRQAGADFGSLEGERSLVLVTDGIESCNGDPVAAARELREQNVTVHVIGFGFGNSVDEDTASLRAIAAASGGHFLIASSANELRAALETTVGTRFIVTRDNVVVARSALGRDERLSLAPGDYQIELQSSPPLEVEVNLGPSDDLKLTLEKNRGVVSPSERRDRLQPGSCEQAMTSATGLSEDRPFGAATQ